VANQSISLDRVFHALSDPTRRGMIARLVHAPATVGQLAGPLPMSLPSAMQHLQVLQDCGLVTTTKVGRVRTCSISPAGLRLAEDWLGDQRTAWEVRLDRLEDFLDEPAPESTNRPRERKKR
jgi:DNA-binding transcriptional ArsR family regulator